MLDCDTIINYFYFLIENVNYVENSLLSGLMLSIFKHNDLTYQNAQSVCYVLACPAVFSSIY